MEQCVRCVGSIERAAWCFRVCNNSSKMKTVFEHSPPSPAGETLSPFVTRQLSGSVFQQPNVTPSRTADAKRYKFLRRFVHFRHMDFEYALWQMLHLFISPQKVYVYKTLISITNTFWEVNQWWHIETVVQLGHVMNGLFFGSFCFLNDVPHFQYWNWLHVHLLLTVIIWFHPAWVPGL